MAGSPFASEHGVGSLVDASSEGSSLACRVTVFAGPLLILIVPLSELGRLSSVDEFAGLVASGTLGWAVAAVVLLALGPLLRIAGRLGRVGGSRWVRIALLITVGAIAGVARAVVLRSGGAAIGLEDTLDALPRMLIAAQVGAIWALTAAVVGVVVVRYRSIRAAQIGRVALARSLTVPAEATTELHEQLIASGVREAVHAATRPLKDACADASTSTERLGTALAATAASVREISHTLERAPMPDAMDVRVSLSEMTTAAFGRVPPTVRSVVVGYAAMAALTFTWTSSRVGLAPAMRSAAILIIGSAAVTGAARLAWHRWQGFRPLATGAFLCALGALLPFDLLVAAITGDSASTSESSTRLLLAPIAPLVILLLLTLASSHQIEGAEWERSVGAERIEQWRLARVRAGTSQRTGRALHAGALSRLHAAALAMSMVDTHPPGRTADGRVKIIGDVLRRIDEDLRNVGDACSERNESAWMLAQFACELALHRWSALVRIETRIDPALAGAYAPACASRIISEAVTNAVRHGSALCIEIELLQRDGQLLLSVLDDGTGPPSRCPAGQGSRDLDYWAPGRWCRTSRVGGGTVLRAALPLAESRQRAMPRTAVKKPNEVH